MPSYKDPYKAADETAPVAAIVAALLVSYEASLSSTIHAAKPPAAGVAVIAAHVAAPLSS